MATHQVPEWETSPSYQKRAFFSSKRLFAAHSPPTPKESSAQTSVNVSLSDRLDRVVPRNRTYLGLGRKIFLLCVLGLILLIFVLGLGLGLGLRHKSSNKNLPLPSNKATFNGDLTYYAPGLGSCGVTSTSTDAICAVSHIIYDAASTSSNPNNNPLCFQKIRITRYDPTRNGNHSVDVTVVDRCVGCKATDLDLSLGMFEQLAEEAQGRVTGSWAWLT